MKIEFCEKNKQLIRLDNNSYRIDIHGEIKISERILCFCISNWSIML